MTNICQCLKNLNGNCRNLRENFPSLIESFYKGMEDQRILDIWKKNKTVRSLKVVY